MCLLEALFFFLPMPHHFFSVLIKMWLPSESVRLGKSNVNVALKKLALFFFFKLVFCCASMHLPQKDWLLLSTLISM